MQNGYAAAGRCGFYRKEAGTLDKIQFCAYYKSGVQKRMQYCQR